jgi:hypothetical protein
MPTPHPLHGGSLLDRVRAAVVGTAREFWPRAVAEAVQAGQLEFEAFTVLQDVQSPTPCGAPPQARLRLPPRTRCDRWEERPATPSGRWVGRVSLDPMVDWDLSDGAVRCLQLVVSLAGGIGRSVVTLTSSIAKQIGRTARTVQNYWNSLAAAGYIRRTFDRRSGRVTVTVTDLVAPPPMPEVKKPWPRPPNPMAAWKRKRLVGAGAKLATHMKIKDANPALLEDSVLTAEANFAVQPRPT